MMSWAVNIGTKDWFGMLEPVGGLDNHNFVLKWLDWAFSEEPLVSVCISLCFWLLRLYRTVQALPEADCLAARVLEAKPNKAGKNVCSMWSCYLVNYRSTRNYLVVLSRIPFVLTSSDKRIFNPLLLSIISNKKEPITMSVKRNWKRKKRWSKTVSRWSLLTRDVVMKQIRIMDKHFDIKTTTKTR